MVIFDHEERLTYVNVLDTFFLRPVKFLGRRTFSQCSRLKLRCHLKIPQSLYYLLTLLSLLIPGMDFPIGKLEWSTWSISTLGIHTALRYLAFDFFLKEVK